MPKATPSNFFRAVCANLVFFEKQHKKVDDAGMYEFGNVYNDIWVNEAFIMLTTYQEDQEKYGGVKEVKKAGLAEQDTYISSKVMYF